MMIPKNSNEYFLATSPRAWAMIIVSFTALALAAWGVHLMNSFMTEEMLKAMSKEHSFDLYKRMIDGITWATYLFIAGGMIGIAALTSTKFSAQTKLGSFSVDGDEPEPKPEVTVTGDANVTTRP